MTEQPCAEGDHLRTVAMGLVAAFESLGAEHQALTAEEKETTAKERQGTVRRMVQSITDASRTLVHAVNLLAQVHGMRALGIGNQMAKDADGRAYSPLFALGNPDELLYETASCVQVVARRLSEAYQPTKKYPSLATARKPQEMKTVLSSLRTALTGLCVELTARNLTQDAAESDEPTDPDLTEGIVEFDECIAFLDELESRTCVVLPAQAAGPTADDVTAAILASPDIARAAAAALERASAR
ncbi:MULTISPECIES: hypothetical protein [unclassified Streptomyces]|uniref:Uncharacterized protein n=1 Tax=Streptomyces sp. NBC_00060 TaxID=2975636 RepID=A0AAU2HAW7_9ACTN